MKRLINRMHGGQKGFTLIELLVVIAILGVIAAVVALNIAGFFGRGTLQAANTELHQAQTAIIALMADAESNRVVVTGNWSGEEGVVTIGDLDASDYVYGPFRAEYYVVNWAPGVSNPGAITGGICDYDGGWGDTIAWDTLYMNWKEAD